MKIQPIQRSTACLNLIGKNDLDTFTRLQNAFPVLAKKSHFFCNTPYKDVIELCNVYNIRICYGIGRHLILRSLYPVFLEDGKKILLNVINIIILKFHEKICF